MSVLYYCLGALAKLNSRVALWRLNGVPGNLLLMAALAYYCASLWRDTSDAFYNSQTPSTVSLEQIGTSGASPQRYVRVSGVFLSTVVYRNEDGSVTSWWSPLADLQSGRLLLIKRSGTIHAEESHEVSVTGMLRQIHAEARKRLADSDDRIRGWPIETRYELVEGEHPGDALRVAVVAALVTLFFGTCCFVIFRRNVIFQNMGRLPTPLKNIPSERRIAVWGTGRYILDPKTTRHFVHVPATLTVENGFPILRSVIDTSSRFMGVSTRDRVGTWSISTVPGSVEKGRFGFLYFGFSRCYAFRFTYSDARVGKRLRAVVAVDRPEALGIAAAMIAGGKGLE